MKLSNSVKVFCGIALVLFLINLVSATILSNDTLLHGYYSFSESSGNTSSDSITPAHNLEFMNNTWGTGINGKGIIQSIVTVSQQGGASAGYNLNTLTGFTQNIWINRTGSLTATTDSSLLGTSDNPISNGDFGFWSANCANQTAQMGLDIKDYSSRQGIGNCTTLVQNAWTMITLTVNTTNAYIYFNGTAVYKYNLNFTFNSKSLMFLSDGNNGKALHNAIADEMGIWNRSITPTEVAQLYNSGMGYFYPFSVAPLVSMSIIYPANQTYTSAVTRINITTSTDVTSCQYSINNWATNTTFTCAANKTGLSATQGSNTWLVSASNGSANSLRMNGVTFSVDSVSPNVSVIFPTNITYGVTPTTLNFTRSTDSAFCLYSTNGGTTNITMGSCTNVTGLSASVGANVWLVGNNDSAGNKNMSKVTFFLGVTNNSINIPTPINQSYIYSTNQTNSNILLNISVIETSVPLSKCWFNSTYNSTLTFTTCNVIRQINLTNIFGRQTIYVFSNDTSNNIITNQTTITIYKNIFDAESYETQLRTFVLELWNMTTTPTNAVLNYSGTNHTGTITNLGNGLFNLSSTFDLPLGATVNNYSWWFYDGTLKQSDYISQTVGTISLGLCNATLVTSYLNISFRNETLGQENITASVSGNMIYWLGSGTVTKTYSFSSASQNLNYTFCFTPNNKTVNTQETVSYYNPNSPQRAYQGTNSLNSSLSSRVLYLLPNSAGIYVTFQVINAAEQPLEGVSINLTRQIDGVDFLVGSLSTGASGTATFWLNPDYAHTLVALLSPYPLYTITQIFADAQYTISLGSGTATNVSDYQKGITYSILPLPNNYFQNGTDYSINFTISSSYWALDSYGFNITDEDGNLIDSVSGTTSGGGLLNVNVNTGTHTDYCINYYWIVNGTQTYNSRCWKILDTSGNIFSISHLLTDLTTYVTSGFFGITNFGIGIIIFIIIVLVTGTIRVKYGISDETVILGIVFALVALFDVSFSLIPNPVGAIPHFPTVFMAVLFSGFMFKEVFQ